MEIEAKYRLDAADMERVAALRDLGAYTLRPAPEPELQRNHYFDTADGRLRQARYGLRVRELPDRALITLKGPASVAADGVHRRAEFEFPGSDPHPAAWPPGEARDLAVALISAAPLVELLTIDTERRIFHVDREGEEVAELCLDRGAIAAGGRTAPICELEVELRPAGVPADLAAIAAALRAHIPLEPELRSKLARGLALLDEA
jgi:inorganic triphosphatase YgiF